MLRARRHRRPSRTHGAAAAGLLAALVAAGCGSAPGAHAGVRAVAAPAKVVASSPPTATPAPLLPSILHRTVTFTDQSAAHPGAPQVAADSGILVDIDSGYILWERNPHLAHAPASTTKVLTALVAMENFSMSQRVSITPAALDEQPDETVMGLSDGETLTVQELLTGMLLVSGNDAANALAADTVGMGSFVATMNAQEAALGLHDSHFVSPVGLDDPGQMASAYDLAAIASVDVGTFPLFRQLVAAAAVDLPATRNHKEYDLENLDQLLQLYPLAVGIKPGWTGDAGYCLVGMAVQGGHRLIAVLMNGNQAAHEERALLDWGFTQEGLPWSIPPDQRYLPTPAPAR